MIDPEEFSINHNCIHQILNAVPGIEEMSYLELGVDSGAIYNKVACKVKVGVDIKPRTFIKYGNCTTDAFFKSIGPEEKFDFIFIDADHSFEAVTRDFLNAVDHIKDTGAILLHDLVPPTEAEVVSCGDGFKLLWALRRRIEEINSPIPRLYTIPSDMGLTFVFPPDILPYGWIAEDLSYETFINDNKNYKMYTPKEVSKILNEYIIEGRKT